MLYVKVFVFKQVALVQQKDNEMPDTASNAEKVCSCIPVWLEFDEDAASMKTSEDVICIRQPSLSRYEKIACFVKPYENV